MVKCILVQSHQYFELVNFQARLGVADDVLQAIASLNSLDMQLYKHAQKIFAKQRRQMLQKVVGSVSTLKPSTCQVVIQYRT